MATLTRKAVDKTGSVFRANGGCLVAILASIFFVLLALLFVASQKGRGEMPGKHVVRLYLVPSTVKLRPQPSVSADPSSTLERGVAFEQSDVHGVWVKVRSAAGIEGWAERSQFESEKEYERRRARSTSIRQLPPLEGRTERRAALHSGPGMFYPVVGELENKEPVLVYTRDHDYFAVDLEGDIAYVDVDSVDVTSGASVQFDVADAGTGFPDSEPAPGVEEPVAPIPAPAAVPALPPGRTSRVFAAVPAGGTQPRVTEQRHPRYPLLARRAGTEGAVVIRAIIRRDGSVGEIEILQDLPNGLGEAAREAVRGWRFDPATWRGEPIDVYYTVTVNFRLKS